MTKREQREAAVILERLAHVVADGEITAGGGFVGRLEGAATALKVMEPAAAARGSAAPHTSSILIV